MMHCDQIRDEQIASRYIQGDLEDAERSAFEAHYFNCRSCLEELEDLQSIAAELRRSADRGSSEHPSGGLGRRWLLGAVAASVLLAALLWLPRMIGRAPGAGSAAEGSPFLVLAEFDAPSYRPSQLRDPETDASRLFRDAMQEYASGRHAQAIPVLRQVAALDPADMRTRFFLGICLVLDARLEDGIIVLTEVTRVEESVYFEEALFYRAKASLRLLDIAAAQEDLEAVIRLQGELEPEARSLREELHRLSVALEPR